MINRLLYAIVFSLTLFSCSEDLGNYDYHDLNEIEISGVDASLSALTQSRLQLDPVLTPAPAAEDQYTFEWKTIALSQDQTETVLGTTRNLDYEVKLPAGSYSLLFTVTEKSSEIFWREIYALQVSESTSEGWLVLCADGAENRVRLDMVSKVTGETYLDILKDKNMPTLTGPRHVMWSKYADANSPYYLLADNGATRLGRNGLEWKEEYSLRYEMGSGAVTGADCITDVIGGKMMVSGTKAFFAECMVGIGLFGSVDNNLKVAPVIGANIKNAMIMVPVALLYDTENKRFMGYAPNLQADEVGGYKPLQDMNDLVELLKEIPKGGKVTGTAFGDFPVGLDFVYMENTKYDPNNTNMGVTYTILSGGGKRYLYGIQLGELWTGASFSSAFALGKVTYGDLSGCTNIDQAEQFAFSSLKNFMYYAVGGAVYRVDLSTTPYTATQQFILPGETITSLKFNLYAQKANLNLSYDLVVGSVKGDAGTVRVYEGFNSDGNFKNVTPTVHTGLGRIVDVTYREMLQ